MANYIERKLKAHPSAQCRVRQYDNGTIELVSYRTTVAICEKHCPGNDCYEVYPFGQYYGEKVYTPTTAKHISAFLKEYFEGITYAEFKKLAEENSGACIKVWLKKGALL
jgi:hypothetical protein